MKVNRTRSFAKKGMRAKDATSKRPEEQLAFNIILAHLDGIEIEQQYRIEFNSRNFAILDIYMERDGNWYAIRLMGPPHDELKAKRHDRLQKIYLERLGIIVIDFGHNDMPNLFLRNKRKLKPIELNRAYLEIKKELLKYNIKLSPYELNESNLQD